MADLVPSWWPMAGYALGFVMGATTGPRFDLYRKWLRRCRTRRVYYDMPSTIAECGGPCSFGGPELCDCGALWRDVPTTPKPDIIPKPQPPPGRVIDIHGCTIGYRPIPQSGTPNPPPRNP